MAKALAMTIIFILISLARSQIKLIFFFIARRGYAYIMTTSLSSDVPAGYFSWAEYDIMAPLQPKTENALAAAFISNCVAHNLRLQALEGLKAANITVDSYGACHRTRDGDGENFGTLLN